MVPSSIWHGIIWRTAIKHYLSKHLARQQEVCLARRAAASQRAYFDRRKACMRAMLLGQQVSIKKVYE